MFTRLITASRLRPIRSTAASFTSSSQVAIASVRTSSSSSADTSSTASTVAAIALTGAALAATSTAATAPSPTQCHCQVPCGIFDDPLRVALLREHAATIRKAMVQITTLSSKSAPSGEMMDAQPFQQASRWVAVKEQAAADIMVIVSEYMLAQRVKRASFSTVEEYRKALEAHHVLLQAAMKAKQTVDVSACDALERAILDVGVMYTR